jgi:hypothetical protein
MAQDLGKVGILAEVVGLELVGADFGVSAAQVARFPLRSKAAFNIEGQRDRDGVIDRVGILERVQLPHAPECLEDNFGVGQDGNWIGLELGIGRTSGFELATEDEVGDGGAVERQGEIPGEKDLGRPVPSEQHGADADVEVAFAGQGFDGGLDSGLDVQGHELALLFVDFGLVSGVNLLGFSPGEGQVIEALLPSGRFGG